ncbi:MAG: thioredoxin-disulfide reductase [Firmicutes bacterium]|nr:thioredoxin-disulfide reductase [Bacillota bacterium]HOB34210.1 thioredoxin-disulfide reductase [Bacillota bacterium]HPZ90204.1 thioredoxin-disulfide reductase [Bacillota bacterium]HQE01594.1 thioredoxin-disulfide reductase [Bacillota bacterium]
MSSYDVIIIGGGPGGLAAGIYAARAKLSTLIIEKSRVGGQAATTEEMENYPGFFQGTTGPQLTQAMYEHARHFGCQFCKDEVVDLELEGWEKVIVTKQGRYTAKAVIIATGAEPRTLGVKGEAELKGKGVSYCATCDADFFEDLEVVVVGNGDAAIEEAIYLTRFAAKVTIVVIHDEGVLDATKIIQERAFANEKIHFVWNSVLEEIKGDGIVQAVAIKNLKTGAVTELATDGVFIFVGTVPRTEFLRGKLDLDERGYIPTTELMETSVDGVYAVGDVRQKFLRQVVTAAADGAIAAVAAEKYIHEEENFRKEVLEKTKPVALMFWSPFHKESLAAVPVVEEVAAANAAKLDLVKIDTYRNQRIARRYGVEEMPALLLVKGGEVAGAVTGPMSRDSLEDLIKSI